MLILLILATMPALLLCLGLGLSILINPTIANSQEILPGTVTCGVTSEIQLRDALNKAAAGDFIEIGVDITLAFLLYSKGHH